MDFVGDNYIDNYDEIFVVMIMPIKQQEPPTTTVRTTGKLTAKTGRMTQLPSPLQVKFLVMLILSHNQLK